MKRFLFIIVTFIMGLIIVYSIQAERKPSNKLVFKQTLYSQMTTDQTLSIDVFSNSDSLFTNKEAIESLYIASFDQHYKLVPSDFEITQGGKYRYLGDAYVKFTYHLVLPKLEIDYYIKECYLTIYLKNGTYLQAQIGRLSLMKPAVESDISIYNQFGENTDDGHFLTDIHLDVVTNRDIEIQSVCYTVNHCVEIKQIIHTQYTLNIEIEPDVFYYESTALRIFYTLEGELFSHTVETFKYFEQMSRDIPENSYNRVYVID